MRRLLYPFIILIILISFNTNAWELITIQSVGPNGKTFLTRTQHQDDKMPGRQGTFTIKHLSVIAQTVEVGEKFTEWVLKDPDATIPFHQGQQVAFHPAIEAVWTGIPQPIPLTASAVANLSSTTTITDSSGQQLTRDDQLLEIFFTVGPIAPPPPLNKGVRLLIHRGIGLRESVSGGAR